MNSLIQTLYHTAYFRKVVYHIPTTENDMPSGSIPLALQNIFYKFQNSETSVATNELIKSFCCWNVLIINSINLGCFSRDLRRNIFNE
ncbi:putative ubiquitinyl hydrolase 1 [Helianthus annuus]|nr:putative ubiquitinyl hydrolase 1 [Helianthus annuus]KAJ0662677.1 putative ubiquitinyl hydrolase 1 [Helianthus annuus]